MDLLIDTHVLLWWDGGAERLSAAAQAAIADPANRVFVSAASIWEIAIKSAKGKLRFEGSVCTAIARNQFLPLAISPAHAEAAGGLDWSHADPFDRMLAAQAALEKMVLVHADGIIQSYPGVPQLWAR